MSLDNLKAAAKKKTDKEASGPKKMNVKKHSINLKEPVHNVLKKYAFENDVSIHSIFLEAIDLWLANEQLGTIDELINSNE